MQDGLRGYPKVISFRDFLFESELGNLFEEVLYVRGSESGSLLDQFDEINRTCVQLRQVVLQYCFSFVIV